MIPQGFFRLLLAGVVVIHHSTPLKFGGWAVLMFFVLSGFWISKMWDEKYSRTPSPLTVFVISRWWRLFPVMALCICLYFLWVGNLQGYSTLWFARQLPIAGSTWSGTPIPPQWSLDVEMQFYLTFAVLATAGALLCRRFAVSGAGWCAIGMVCLSIGAIHLGGGGRIYEPNLFPWLGLFMMGLAINKSNWAPSQLFALSAGGTFVLGTLALVAWPATRQAFWAVGSEASTRHFAGVDVLASWPRLWIFAGVLLFLPYTALVLRETSSQKDRFFGNLAYPLYMFHWIPREWFYAHADWNRPIAYNASLLLVNILAAFAGAWLIYICFDRPIDRLRTKWLARRAKTAS